MWGDYFFLFSCSHEVWCSFTPVIDILSMLRRDDVCSMIHAGYIHLQLDTTMSNKHDSLNLYDISQCLKDEDSEQLQILNMIQKLDNVIKVTVPNGLDATTLALRVELPITEEDIGHIASSDLLDLLTFVNRSRDPKRKDPPFERTATASSLLEIFVHMSSPKIDKTISSWCENSDILGFLLEDIQTEIPGMKTTLYNYQKNSLWKILQREMAPLSIEPYETVKLRAVDGAPYYIHQLTGEITQAPPEFIVDAQGGIICEDMGTGKTCICLSVIMATKDLSRSVYHGDKHLKSDYPYHTNKETRIPRLKHIAALSILKSGLNWKPIHKQLPPDLVDDWFRKYPVYYEWTNVPSHYDFERARRLKPVFTTLKVYLSHSTLVVVPDNLVAQWTGEIYKHIKDGHLKFVVYDDVKQKLCRPVELISYDLVLISQNRFSHEHSIGGLEFCSHVCRCSSSTGVCACNSNSDKYVSPLLQVHWKRLIVDEGHRLSAKNRQAELSAKLFSNWKWICTGTPTQNLTESVSAHTRQASELDDLNRLGTLFGQTLGIEPFKSNKKLWPRLISQPFLKRKPWAVSKLAQMMERVMIRNQRVDMDKEVTLPPLYRRTVYLDFDYYQWIAHNCQIAMISLNAILSKREGADYLFSPKNQKPLRETVHNLWQSCLWHSVEPSLIQSAYDNCIEKCHQVTDKRADYGEKDNEDLFRIRGVLEHALSDKMFLCIMTHHSPSYVVQGLPALFRETWGWLQGGHGAYVPVGSLPWDDHCIVNADRVIDAMDQVIGARGDDTKNLFVYNGIKKTLVSVEEYEAAKKWKKLQEAQLKKKKATQQKQKERQQMLNLSRNVSINEGPANSQEQQQQLAGKTIPGGQTAVTPAETTEGDAISRTDNETVADNNEPEEQLTFYTRNAFSDAQVLSSTSIKLNYLIDQIYKYQQTEKCIIFSQHVNEMYEIYLALQLARIRVLLYQNSKMNNVKRSQMILTFNTSENANVIIMAVQKAAYGIDLSSATRVYFVSPVWQPAMEQQAIKRAHRIGQKKPVFVETLIIRNTIEDALLQRRDQVFSDREESHDKENLKRGDFYTDSKLKDILNHAHFVPVPEGIMQDSETGFFRQKIIPLEAPLEFITRKTSVKVEEEEQKLTADDSEGSMTTAAEKLRTVSFGDTTPTMKYEPSTTDQKVAIDVDDNVDIDIEMNESNLEEERDDSADTEQMVFKTEDEPTGEMVFKTEDESTEEVVFKTEDEPTEPMIKSEDEPLIDIEGNHDAQDRLQAWKLRLLDQANRELAAKNQSQPAAASAAPKNAVIADGHNLQPMITGFGTNEPPSTTENASSVQKNIHEDRPKKKRKTVSFAL